MSSGSAFGVSRRDQLARLTLAVAYAVGAHPSCIAGTAILVRVAEQFGFQLTPRAVAVAGQADDGRVFSTGRAATEHLQAHGAVANDVTIVAEETTWAEDSGFRRTGHLIAFDERGNYLLDPSFEQFVK